MPVKVPGGLNPVIAVPGYTPRLPLTIVKPALVIVVPASTPYVPAVPRLMSCCAWTTCVKREVISSPNNMFSEDRKI